MLQGLQLALFHVVKLKDRVPGGTESQLYIKALQYLCSIEQSKSDQH